MEYNIENINKRIKNEIDYNLLDEITGDYTALVIKNSASATTPEECLFWYKADPENFPKNWKFGSSTAWEFHNDRRDPHAVESL